MTLEVAGCEPIEEPTEEDIGAGLERVFQSSSEFLILNSTSYCYVQATKASDRGLVVEYWDGENTPVYRTDRDNVTMQEARVVFLEFADQRSGWKNTLVWSPVFQPGEDPHVVNEVVPEEEEKHPFLKRIEMPSIVAGAIMFLIGIILIKSKASNPTFLGADAMTFLMLGSNLCLAANLHDLTRWRKFRWYERGHPFWAVIIALMFSVFWIIGHFR